MRSRIQTPAGFSGPVPVNEEPEQVPGLNTAPERLSSEKFQLVQLIFFDARKSRYFWELVKSFPPSPLAVWVPNSVTNSGILLAARLSALKYSVLCDAA